MSERVLELNRLREPFPREDISWRAQQVSKRDDGSASALALAYVDARAVIDRLDEVCGPENWQTRYSFSPDGKKTICEIGIRVEGEWIWKADGAGDSDIEAEKGALSDAFKRAGVKWGIARDLYDLKSPWVPCEVGHNGKWRKFLVDPWEVLDRGHQNTRAPKGDNAPSRPVGGQQQRSAPTGGTRQPSGTSAPGFGSTGISLVCDACGVKITEKVASYSRSKFGRPLCMEDQKTASVGGEPKQRREPEYDDPSDAPPPGDDYDAYE